MKTKRIFSPTKTLITSIPTIITIITWIYVDKTVAYNNPDFQRDMPTWIIIIALLIIAFLSYLLGFYIENLIKKTTINYLAEKSDEVNKYHKKLKKLKSNILMLKNIEDAINNHAKHIAFIEKYSNASSHYLQKDLVSGESIPEHKPTTINLTNEHS